MSKKNIKYQFLYAINQHFKENQDKHSLKKEHLLGQATIYSYSSRSNLIDISANFANWMKISHPEIALVKNISSEHIAEFLAYKSNSCSQKTLEQYKTLLHKLSLIVNSTYHCNIEYTKDIVTPKSFKNGGSKIRCNMLEYSDYQTLLKTTNINLKNALLLSQNFGLRASEISKLRISDIASDKIKIIDSKGKKNRMIPIETAEQKQAIISILSSNQKKRICNIQHESLQQAFRRELKKNGLDSKYKNGCFHMCRKYYATIQYQKARANGLTVKESMSRVSVLLGHGENRFELMREYICCPIV